MKRYVIWFSTLLIVALLGACGENTPPIIDEFNVPENVAPGSQVDFQVVAHDADEDILTYTWKVDNTLLNATTQTITWKAPNVDQYVAFEVRWKALNIDQYVTVEVSVSDGVNDPVIRRKNLKVIPDISGVWKGRIGYYPFLEFEPKGIANLELTLQQDGQMITGRYRIYGGDMTIKNPQGDITDGSFDGKELKFTYYYYVRDPLRNTDVKQSLTVIATYDITKVPEELHGYWAFSFDGSLKFVVMRR